MMLNTFSYAYLLSIYLLCLRSFVHFHIGFFVFLLSVKSSLYIQDNSLLSRVVLANISSWSVPCFLILTKPFFSEQKILVSMRCSSSIISFTDCAFSVVSKKSLPYSRSSRFFIMFYSGRVIALHFVFKPMIHFELMLVNGVRFELYIIFLYYSFSVHGICSDEPSSIYNFINLCLLSFSLVSLARDLSI